jgi:hypothetical protein
MTIKGFLQMTYIKTIIIILVILLSCINVNAEPVPAAFVDIGYGARPAGMGGAYTAVSDDANAIVWNPAGLAQIDGHEVIFMNTTQKYLIPYQYFAYGRKFVSGAAVGVGVIFSGDDALFERTVIASYSQTLSYISERRNKPKTSIGATYKLRLADFGNNEEGGPDRVSGNASGHAIDAGLLYHWKERVFLGVCFHDSISQLNWTSSTGGTYEENVPRRAVFGMSYRIPDSLTVAGDIEYPDRIRMGVEKNFTKRFALRAGYNQKLEADPYGECSIGLGLTNLEMALFSFSLNMSYRFERLADTLRLSVSLNF